MMACVAVMEGSFLLGKTKGDMMMNQMKALSERYSALLRECA
jgi:hypothetical protein